MTTQTTTKTTTPTAATHKIEWDSMTDSHGAAFTNGYSNGQKVADIGRYDLSGRADYYCAVVYLDKNDTNDTRERYFLLHDCDGWENVSPNVEASAQRGFKTALAALSAAKKWAQEVAQTTTPAAKKASPCAD